MTEDMEGIEAERMCLAAIQDGKKVECRREHYVSRVREAIRGYADQNVRAGETLRAIRAISEVKRLDREHGFSSRDADNSAIENGDDAEYRDWQPDEGSPMIDELGFLE